MTGKIINVQKLLNSVSHSANENEEAQNDLHCLKTEGIYLFYLLRNHYQVENTSVYQEIEQELTEVEKSVLMRKCLRLNKYFNNN